MSPRGSIRSSWGEHELAVDVTTERTDGPQPAVRDRHRLEILRLLSGAASDATRIARELGLSRSAVERHLADLHECGLVDVEAGPERGAVYTLNALKAAMLSASFVRMVGHARDGGPTIPDRAKDAPKRKAPAAPTLSPEVCSQCEN